MVPARHAFHSFFVHVPDGIMTADMERGMIRRRLLSLAGAAAAGCVVFGMAQAAPATGALEGLKTLALEPGNVEQARRRCHQRRCWRYGGYWRCRRWCRHWW
jgi:hypothetical protein